MYLSPSPSSTIPESLSPINVGPFILPNRYVMGSMHTNLEEIEGGFERAAVFYAERAKGGAGLIITGGIAPNEAGWVGPHSAKLTNQSEIENHKKITRAVHEHQGKICMQILHAGRYGFHQKIVAPSPFQAPINFFKPKELTGAEILETIEDFGLCAARAEVAGYDGVEIMGSEGYLINEFLVTRTNHRLDDWGGSYENRMRFPLEIVKSIKQKTKDNFLIIFRLSMLDLVEEGSTWKEVVQLARELEKAGVHVINTGIGWHEARIPTIASSVPRMAFAWVTKKMKQEISIPLIAVNRINTPEIAETIVSEGFADLISMARPFLADPAFVNKSKAGRSDLINTCIACNQACLDHTFQLKISSCLVNPRACHETELPMETSKTIKKIAVIGAGPAGLAFAVTAAERGHSIEVFEKNETIGGQFILAKNIPGKEDYAETIRYFTSMLKELQIPVHVNALVSKESFPFQDYDTVILSTGVKPRLPDIPGIHRELVMDYETLLSGRKKAGKKVGILGAGGIGFDVAEYLLGHQSGQSEADIREFLKNWGVDVDYKNQGGLTEAMIEKPPREIYLFKRSTGKHGNTLGKTTGWIKKLWLQKKNVHMLGGVSYDRIENDGIWITQDGASRFVELDTIVLCTGQELAIPDCEDWKEQCREFHVIGGAFEAGELDAKKAVDQAVRLAAII